MNSYNMTAQDIWEYLLQLQVEGIKLESLEVIIGQIDVDSDYKVPAYLYPSLIEVVHKTNELLIR